MIDICFMHIGEIIHEVIDNNNVNIKELATEIGTSRSNLYNIFGRKTIDTDTLYALSKKLNYDFFGHFSSELQAENCDIEKSNLEYNIEKSKRPRRRVMLEVDLSEEEYMDLIKRSLK